jgi:NAD(P)-dependent dehydrogenase (short-subunit alcohol dehydrogenase family)
LDAVAREVRDAAGTVAYVRQADISSLQDVRAMADEIHGQGTSLDVVMNIAGIAIWGTVERLGHSDWQRQIDVNLMGPIHVIECFIPPMIAAGRGGHLVNVCSAAGLFGLPWHVAYSASKFGLRGISEVLRNELRRHDIGVSLVCPGRVDTGFFDAIQIAGVDRNDPRFAALTSQFRGQAVSPERAAAAIIAGVKKNRYMVYTSLDIRAANFVRRKFALPYELAIRRIGDRFDAAGEG